MKTKFGRIALSLSSYLLLIKLTLLSASVNATPFVLGEWQTLYPNSRSDSVACQLCHESSNGGIPWNAYGWDIRKRFRANPQEGFSKAIEYVAEQARNSDTDDLSNIEEINANQQPGWALGPVNSIFSDAFPLGVGNLFAPVNVDPFIQKIQSQESPIALIEVASGFTSPVGAVVAPVSALAEQLFVVDQVGVIWRLNLSDLSKEIYIDLRSETLPLGAFSPGGYDERGLLGLAFHPNFSSNGRLYIYISKENSSTPDFTTLVGSEVADHQSVVEELVVAEPISTKGPATIIAKREILRIDQPQFNHNGGDLLFDNEHMLFISLGDGGGADDQGIGHGMDGNGGDPSNPYGAILRIDPLGNSAVSGKYGIPNNNPFINDSSKLDEIYAYGFRNPWKLSIDKNDDLWVADVGQNNVEEINLVIKGGHYGWNHKEGRFFFDDNGGFDGIIGTQVPNDLPNDTLIDPVLEYDHDEGISVIGGHIYRGSEIPGLTASYVFADFQKRLFFGNTQSGEIKAMDVMPEYFIFAIARDSKNELYILGNHTAETSGQTGVIQKLVSTLQQSDELCFPIFTKAKKAATVCL